MTPARIRRTASRRDRPRTVAALVLSIALLVGAGTSQAQDIEVETVDRIVRGLTAFEVPSGATPGTQIALQDQQVGLRDILSVRYSRSQARETEFEIGLADGTRLKGLLVPSKDEDSLTLRCSLFPEDIQIPISWIREIRHRATESQREAPEASGLDTDRLSTREGAELEGIMLTLTADGLTFEDSKLGELEFSWPQVTLLRLAALETPPAADPSRLQIAIESADGTQLRGALERLTRTEISVESPLIGKHVVPVSRVSGVEFLLGRVEHLSDRDPKKAEEGHPYITPETFQRFFSWRRDRSVGPKGGPLTIGDRTFRRGLGVHSRSELVFAVEPGDVTFQAWIGLDRSARPEQEVADYGAVVFRVLIDGKDAFAPRPMNWQLPAQRVEVPLDGVKELTLLVEPGPGEHVLDRANWGDARVLRK